jgi:hypothetical protein
MSIYLYRIRFGVGVERRLPLLIVWSARWAGRATNAEFEAGCQAKKQINNGSLSIVQKRAEKFPLARRVLKRTDKRGFTHVPSLFMEIFTSHCQ